MEEPSCLKDLIPKVLQGRKIWVAKTKLLAQKSPNGQKNKLTLVMCWNEDDRQTVPFHLTDRRSSEKFHSPKPASSGKKSTSDKTKQMITCDGPCHELKPPRKVHTMGRCDHYICDFCYKITNNPDGSAGCSAFDCMRRNVYRHLNDRDARENYNRDVAPVSKGRKERYENGLFKFADHGPSVSNPPSIREDKSPPRFVDSKEVTDKAHIASAMPVHFPEKQQSNITVRTMVFHKHCGHGERTVMAESYVATTELKRVIKHSIKMALGHHDGPARAALGTSENYALFRSLDNDLIQKPLIEFTGTNGKLNLIIDTMEKLSV